jgi:hypothetical protein
MEAISISTAIAGAATVITIVAVHEATERQRQAAQEQARFAQQLIEQHRTRGMVKSKSIRVELTLPLCDSSSRLALEISVPSGDAPLRRPSLVDLCLNAVV